VNIAAVMATLELWDVDRNAKHAVLVVACRATVDGVAQVSIPRVAADMGVGYYAAAHALRRAVASGHLEVIHSQHGSPRWYRVLTAVPVIHNPRDSAHGVPRSDRGGVPRSRPRSKDSLDISKEGAAAVARDRRAAAPVENPPVDVYARLPNWTAERLNGRTT
jgi:hypothetical protein